MDPPRLRRILLMALVMCGLFADHLSVSGQVLPAGAISAQTAAQISQRIGEAIEQKQLPGCVICVGRADGIFFLNAYGNRQVEPEAKPMAVDTVFDLASLTKPIATATSIMLLIEENRLSLETRVAEIFPEFGQNGKDTITIEHLLTHQSGLIPDNALSDYDNGPEVAWKKICELGLISEVGKTFKYSDVNFIVLGEVVRALSGERLDAFARHRIFEPAGMNESGFVPQEELRARAAPTERRNGIWIQGEVHDPRAFALGGVAGHAGLFSTADDLARYAQMMLTGGRIANDQGEVQVVMKPATVELMTKAYQVSSGTRALGWDMDSPYSSNRGTRLSKKAFGHGGFTGTVLWIDPGQDRFFIFLSNRVHPDGSGSVNRLAGEILDLIVDGMTQQESPTSVLTGIDVLERDGLDLFRGQRIGLLTNHTGRDRNGRLTSSLLHDAAGIDLRLLFSPEHGPTGNQDRSDIADAVDEATGLPIVSLYGRIRRPSAESLDQIDTLVFDIQDVGARFYTYVSTMREVMLAADQSGKRFVVLDRPNPINGVDVEGPMLDAGSESFVACHNLPIRHGMTTGEIARLLRDELKLSLDLHVVPCEGWRRDMYWEATNLTWVNPSPNMRSLTAAMLYPGVGLLETTNLSVGRGTDTPFEILGAPWIDGRRLASCLNERRIPGVVFVPVEFTPSGSKFANETCHGINLVIVDRAKLKPVTVGLEVACALRKLYPDQWETKNLNVLLGNRNVIDAIDRGATPDEVIKRASEKVDEFIKRRQRVLIYR